MAQRYQGPSNRKRANRRDTRSYHSETQRLGEKARVPFESVVRPTHLLCDPLEVEVARSPKGTSLTRKGKRKVSTKAQNIHPTHTWWTSFLSETGKGLRDFPFLPTSSYSYRAKKIAKTNFITSLASLIPMRECQLAQQTRRGYVTVRTGSGAATGQGHTWTSQDSNWSSS